MYSARAIATPTYVRKPRIFIDKTFTDLGPLEVGKKGQIHCTLKVIGMNKEMDDNGNEIIKYNLEFARVDSVVIT